MKKRKKTGIICVICLVFLTGIILLYGDFPGKRKKETEAVIINGLKVCHLHNPLGIDEAHPVFSWKMESGRTGAGQSAYRICVAESQEGLKKEVSVWDSGKVPEDESAGIVYEGEALRPKTRYYWQVQVWDENEKCHFSSEEAWFETGLMGEGMAGAKWISAPEEAEADEYGEEDYSFSIRYRMEVENTAAAFIFGAEGGRYGEMYLCEIRNEGEESFFTLRHMDQCMALSEEEVQIVGGDSPGGTGFEVELAVQKERLMVRINGQETGEFSLEPTAVKSIGYYKSREASYAWLDDILVQDGDGEVLCQEDFEGEENIFAPYHVEVRKGRLRVGSGLMLTAGWEEPAPLFRKEFSVRDKEIERARVYMAALGSFALSVNGARVSDERFAPGKLAYNQELSYVTYDITELLEKGRSNALGLILLHGWYDRAVGYPEIWSPWGEKNALLGMLEIIYEDGGRDVIATDGSFACCADGPVREDDIYQGEFYDANREQPGFDRAGFSEAGWYPAQENAVEEAYLSLPLVGKKNEPIRCVEILTPVEVSQPVENVFVYDFGQNFAGICRIRVKGIKGQILTLRYGEALNTEDLLNRDDEAGTIWTENLGTAEATDYYVLRGDPEGENFEPEFVFHGFRDVQITGLEEALPAEQVEGLVLSSDLERTGEFRCSDETLNRYYENTLWSQRSNFLDNPMDCPQRDERHGWAGDAQIFSLTASYHRDTYCFYEKYLRELRSIQSKAGSFSDMAPRNFGAEWDGTGGAASHNCWGDAPMVIAWNLYLQYGDQAILKENYEALCRWVDMLVETSENYIRSWGGYGDHLSTEDTPADLSDTAWCAHSADLLSHMADILDKPEDAEYYRQIYENYRQAWQREYVLPDGATVCNTQTSYALGLAFSLFPRELETAAAEHLALLGEYSNYHMNAGYSGISFLLPAYSRNGMVEEAYRMLLQEEYPSLLFAVNHGATTTWESLGAALREEEGGYRLDGSLNHYAYGAPAGWLYTDVLGIRSDEDRPGFKHIFLEPHPGGGKLYWYLRKN